MSNKRGALELSVGTIVIIVIGMSMLILGLVLVRTIFVGSTASIDELNKKVQDQIASLFSEDGTDVVVLLGEGQTARIKPNSGTVNIGIGARTPDGSSVGGRDRLQYKLTLEESTGNNCMSILGERGTQNLIRTPLDTYNKFDSFDGSRVFALIEVDVPKGTAVCSQKVLIDVKDTEAENEEDYGGNFFKIEVLKEGFF